MHSLDHFGYEEQNIRVLTDSESSNGLIGEAMSTRENIVRHTTNITLSYDLTIH